VSQPTPATLPVTRLPGSLSLVLPAFNEEANIERCVRTAFEVLREFGIEGNVRAEVLALPPGHPYLRLPLQFATGVGDEDVYLPHADPALLWPLLRDPRTEDCPVVLLGCYPYVGAAAHLAGTYPQVHMDLSPAIFLAEPIAARLVSEALGLCPPGKLLAGSGGRAYPESHWWGATVWRRALARVLRAEVEAIAAAGVGAPGGDALPRARRGAGVV
jgi:hypothetical protein